jgi:alpha-tubulin suppressor-like RCC1 family protein
MALKNDGTVWAWGSGYSATPVQIIGLTGITAISAGEHHSMALKNDGTVWAWGDNWGGELGDGTRNHKNTPVQAVGLSGIIAISAGHMHSLALKMTVQFGLGAVQSVILP